MKEQIKAPEKIELSIEEIANLSDAELLCWQGCGEKRTLVHC